jgi:predicted glutamine amidotransferase
MCGLVSIILKDNTKVLNKDMTEAFKQLLYADALRGWDSTGICAVKAHGEATVHKDSCAAGPFLYKTNENTWIYQNRALIGHNRWATRGSVTEENAHPFEEGHIILAHNGTLRSHHALKNVAVDSHAITHSIAEKGAIKTLERLDGAFALIWYDKKTQEINVTRNKERPLFIVESEDLFFIVSEAGLARWIMSRNNMTHLKTSQCVPGTLYTFKESKQHRIFIDQTKYKGFVTPPYVAPTYFNHSYGKEDTVLPKQGTSLTTTQAGQTTGMNVTSIRPDKAYPTNDLIAIGDIIDVLFYTKKETTWDNYSLGRIKWEADTLNPYDICLEVYTSDQTDYSDMAGTVEVVRVYFSAHLKQFIVIASNPKVKKSREADETGPSTTSNGVKVTNEVLKLVQDKICIFCEAPFSELKDEEFSQIVLNPKTENNHVYTYTYYCPKCSDYFNLRRTKTK